MVYGGRLSLSKGRKRRAAEAARGAAAAAAAPTTQICEDGAKVICKRGLITHALCACPVPHALSYALCCPCLPLDVLWPQDPASNSAIASSRKRPRPQSSHSPRRSTPPPPPPPAKQPDLIDLLDSDDDVDAAAAACAQPVAATVATRDAACAAGSSSSSTQTSGEAATKHGSGGGSGDRAGGSDGGSDSRGHGDSGSGGSGSAARSGSNSGTHVCFDAVTGEQLDGREAAELQAALRASMQEHASTQPPPTPTPSAKAARSFQSRHSGGQGSSGGSIKGGGGSGGGGSGVGAGAGSGGAGESVQPLDANMSEEAVRQGLLLLDVPVLAPADGAAGVNGGGGGEELRSAYLRHFEGESSPRAQQRWRSHTPPQCGVAACAACDCHRAWCIAARSPSRHGQRRLRSAACHPVHRLSP
jgi:uncharacterized membrane protein YgcG